MAIAFAAGRRLILLAALVLTSPSFAIAQPQAGPAVSQLQAEVTMLRDEIVALKAALADIQRVLGVPSPTPAARVTPEMVDVLKAQIEEQAQVKVESAS